MSLKHKILSALALPIVLMSYAYSGASVEVYFDYKDVAKRIEQFVDFNNPESNIIVYDIDDTLVHIPNCLPGGGENIPAFRRWQVIIDTCPYFATEDRVVDDIKTYQKIGFHTMALTARGGSLEKKSHEQLLGLGIDFLGTPFTSKDNFTTKVTKKKSLVFSDGVALAAGTSKGKALKRFQTEWFERPYSRIVFIDDNKKNISSVRNSFKKDPNTEVLIIHYRRYDH